jgi:hypothetical protein
MGRMGSSSGQKRYTVAKLFSSSSCVWEADEYDRLLSGGLQSEDSSALAPRLPCKGKRGEKPWCLPDNALPSDTPQLAAGRLH